MPARISHLEVQPYTFTLLLQGVASFTPDVVDALVSGGCDDGVFGERDGRLFAEFERDGPSYAHTVTSAMHDVEMAVPGLQVVRVEPESLVSTSDIAARTHRSRESIRLLIAGKRGPGNFPPPAIQIGGKHPLWQWADIERWMTESLGVTVDTIPESEFIAAMNGALELRRHLPNLTGSEEHLIESWVRDALPTAV